MTSTKAPHAEDGVMELRMNFMERVVLWVALDRGRNSGGEGF